MEDHQEWIFGFIPCKYSARLIDKLLSINENRPEKTKIDIVKIQKAIYYAKKYHGDQKRESGEPYYSHPLEVAYMLAEYAYDYNQLYFRTDLLISSILHDTLEDTELTKQMIAEEFGEPVATQVESLTRIKERGKISSEELVLSLVAQKNTDVLVIKMFDRLHNVQTIKAKSFEKIKKIVEETIRVFLLLSIYLDMPHIKNILINFCYENLHIQQHSYSLTDKTSVFCTNNYQLYTPKFQNDVDQLNTK